MEAPPEEASGDFIKKAGFALVLCFIFMAFARVPEMLGAAGITLPITLGISLLAGIAALFVGDFRRLAKMPAVLWLIVFTGWICVAGVFSTWHGGTFQLFKDYWSKSIVICLVIAVLVVNVEQMRRIMYALAYATLAAIGFILVLGGSIGGRTAVAGTSFENPNEIAGRLLSGFCFCLFLIWSERGFSVKRTMVLLAMPALLVIVLRTGSRSGLLTLLVISVMLFLKTSGPKRLMMLVGAAATVLMLFAFLPQETLDRYAVIFSTRQDVAMSNITAEQQMAVGSREARQALAEEAFGIAMGHPLLGVGPGVYEAAAAEEAKAENRRAMWHEAHNTFLQLAAEDGLPGLLLYLIAIGYCLWASFSLYRKCKDRPELETISRISYCLLLALASWIMGAVFDSQGYRLEFPMMAALICAFGLAAKPLVERRMASAPITPSPLPRPAFAARPAPGVSQPLPAAPAPTAKETAQPNRYKFGRLRTP